MQSSGRFSFGQILIRLLEPLIGQRYRETKIYMYCISCRKQLLGASHLSLVQNMNRKAADDYMVDRLAATGVGGPTGHVDRITT
jgi:hypothetical protein